MNTELMNYTHPAVCSRYAQAKNVSIDYAKSLFEETKKFLYTCTISSEGLSPTQEIDDMWHEFILFTRDYRDFCHDILGTFVDHYPDEEVTEESRARNMEQLVNARQLALQSFGDINPEIWYVEEPIHELAHADCGSKCSGNCKGEDTTPTDFLIEHSAKCGSKCSGNCKSKDDEPNGDSHHTTVAKCGSKCSGNCKSKDDDDTDTGSRHQTIVAKCGSKCSGNCKSKPDDDSSSKDTSKEKSKSTTKEKTKEESKKEKKEKK